MNVASTTLRSEEAPPTPLRVLVRGADGSLGARVLDRLSSRDEVRLIDPIEHAGSETAPGKILADVVVELGVGDHDRRARRRESVTSGAADLLADVATSGATHLVLVSSAMVYGALPNNPVPLTEDAVLRPDPACTFARQLASVEEVVEEWRRGASGRTVAVLRPAVTMADDGTPILARALAAGLGQRFAEADPAAQFVHLDDVASAIELAVARRLDGVFNVAADGWVPGERVRALAGETPRLPLPQRMREVVAALRWRFQRGPIPPGLVSYTRETWVVGNDKLRAEGWRPTVTNEQVYVEGTEARWWTMITPKRRQELALGGLAAAVVVAVTGLAATVWWLRRRRTN